MGGLAEKIATLSASLRSEIWTGLATRKALREAKRDSKALMKVVDDADAAAVLDGVRDKFKEALRRRDFYINNASAVIAFKLLETEGNSLRGRGHVGFFNRQSAQCSIVGGIVGERTRTMPPTRRP